MFVRGGFGNEVVFQEKTGQEQVIIHFSAADQGVLVLTAVP